MSTACMCAVFTFTFIYASGKCFPTKAIYKDRRSESVHCFNDVKKKKFCYIIMSGRMQNLKLTSPTQKTLHCLFVALVKSFKGTRRTFASIFADIMHLCSKTCKVHKPTLSVHFKVFFFYIFLNFLFLFLCLLLHSCG